MKNILFLILAVANLVNAQWFWQNPLPQGNSLKELQIVSPNTGYTIGSFGTVLKSVSAGRNWNILKFPVTIDLQDLSFISEDIGWVIGQIDNEGQLYKTSNGGLFWEKVLTEMGKHVSVYFLNENIGWLGIDSLIYNTTDAGINWQTTNMHKNIIQVYFISPAIGWALSTEGVFRTTDNGSSWSYTFLGENITFLYMEEIKMINDQVGWTFGNDSFSQWTFGGYIFKTLDGGENWALQYYSGPELLKDVDFYNTDMGWFITHNNQEMYRTNNGGNDWTEIGSTFSGISEIKSANDSVLWGVGTGGYIITFNDSGTSWQHQTTGSRAELQAVHFLTENYGYIAGDNILLKTTDAGKHWEEKQAPFNPGRISMWFVDSIIGMVSSGNKLWRTTDGGDTWDNRINSSNYLYDINFINVNFGWIGSTSGDIYQTSDGGITWTRIADVDIEVYTLTFNNASVGWCGGYIGFLRTTDGGASWNNINLPVYMVPTDIFFINNQVGWVIGYGEGAILKTTDGGQTWVVQHSFPTYGAGIPRRLFFTDLLNGWAATGKYDLGNVLRTSDGGNTWNPVDLPTNNIMRNFWINSNQNGWILGMSGTILCNDNSIQVSTDEIKSDVLTDLFELNQNHPNPFNPVTIIRYSVPGGTNPEFKGIVELKVYDILGCEIATLVKEEKIAGDYEIEFDGSQLASGVYFYRLTAGTYSETKKMLLLK